MRCLQLLRDISFNTRVNNLMPTLVTGGAGYIGSHFVLDLLDHGEDVLVLDDLSTGFEWAVDRRVRFVKGDTGNKHLVASLLREHGIADVVHFAGSIVVAESVTQPLAYYENNVSKTRTLIEACVETGVARFIFSSSAAVYGIPATNPVGEEAPHRPISPYGHSKAMTEVMLADAERAHGLTFAALRYFNVAGADTAGRSGESTRHATHLVKIACQVAVGRRPFLVIYGRDYPTPDGTCVRDYIHVSDLATAHRLALEDLRAGGGSRRVNCGYGHGFSVREVIEAVRQVSGVSFEVRDGPRRCGDPAELIADASQIRRVLNWNPQYDNLQVIVEHALKWERWLAANGLPDQDFHL